MYAPRQTSTLPDASHCDYFSKFTEEQLLFTTRLGPREGFGFAQGVLDTWERQYEIAARHAGQISRWLRDAIVTAETDGPHGPVTRHYTT